MPVPFRIYSASAWIDYCCRDCGFIPVLNSQGGRGWPSFFMNWRRMRVPGQSGVPPAVCQCFRMMLARVENVSAFSMMHCRFGRAEKNEIKNQEGPVFHVSPAEGPEKEQGKEGIEDGRSFKEKFIVHDARAEKEAACHHAQRDVVQRVFSGILGRGAPPAAVSPGPGPAGSWRI